MARALPITCAEASMRFQFPASQAPKHCTVVQLACVALANGASVADEEDVPSDKELSELDDWATTADRKAEAPATLHRAIDYLRKVYFNRMSVIWSDEVHPENAEDARVMIRARL